MVTQTIWCPTITYASTYIPTYWSSSSSLVQKQAANMLESEVGTLAPFKARAECKVENGVLSGVDLVSACLPLGPLLLLMLTTLRTHWRVCHRQYLFVCLFVGLLVMCCSFLAREAPVKAFSLHHQYAAAPFPRGAIDLHDRWGPVWWWHHQCAAACPGRERERHRERAACSFCVFVR